MSRHCNRCNVDVVDEAIECPLCHGVLELDDEDKVENISDMVSKSSTYPDVTVSLKIMKLVIRIVIFASVIAGITVLLVNYLTFNGVYWSLIVIAGLVYGNLTLLYSFRDRKSIQRIIQVQMLAAIVLLQILDYLLGSKGWSFSYALPILFVGVDVGMVVLMIVGIDGWQTYIMTEIVTFILSIVIFVMRLCGLVKGSFFMIIAIAVTGIILLGTVLFGQKMVENELKRRFKL
ncbi:MAG: hypothetical protein K6F55_00185 [Eubacterium sp.]|nr:hypothetical protein [Eubacterium sp.]